MAKSIVEKVLDGLELYNLTSYKTLINSYTVSSITQQSPTNIRITLTGSISNISAGHYVQISSGVYGGYHKISAVSTNYVDITDSITGLPQAFGTASFYDVKEYIINDLITNAKLYVQKVTGVPLAGQQEIVEYHDGTGFEELMLDRKSMSSITRIDILNIPLDVMNLPVSAVEIIPDTGILRIKRQNVDTYSSITPTFPPGRSNIKVTYNLGYDEDTIPSDIQLSIAYMCIADVLGNEAGYSGGGLSISVVAYSKSYGTRGKYSEARNDLYRKAMSLLGKYKGGVIGY